MLLFLARRGGLGRLELEGRRCDILVLLHLGLDASKTWRCAVLRSDSSFFSSTSSAFFSAFSIPLTTSF